MMKCPTGGLLALFSLILLTVGCGPVNQDQGNIAERPVNAVATTGMIGDLVANIGGERVTVTNLMGPGVDPHLYKASEGDVGRLTEADIIFYNGLHLEGKMAEVLERMGSRVTTVAVAEVLDEGRLLTPSEFKGAHDPHIWFDVSQWIDIAAGIRDRLAELDPEHALTYQENAAAYIERLEALHREVIRKAELIPLEQRILVTAHDAFNYFGRAYGFEVRGLQGISTAAEAGTADVQDLVAYIVNKRIPALFIESSVPVRTIEAVRNAVRSKGFDVSIGGQLFSDAMGDPGTFEGTYLGMVTHNIDTIVRAYGFDPASISVADNAKTKDGFSAQLWLTSDSEVFFKAMQHPETPVLPSTNRAVRGESIETTVLFQNPKSDKGGSIYVTCDFVVLKPDGSIYGEAPGMIGEIGPTEFPPEAIQLGDGRLEIIIEPEDPDGKYWVHATVTDQIRNVSLELKEWFVVGE